MNAFDDFLRKNIGKVEQDSTPSDDFVNNVMYCCYKYDAKKALRSLWVKRSIFALALMTIIAIVIFAPGVSAFLLGIFTHLSWLSLLKYYLISSSVMLISFYLILSERIIKFIKRQRQQESDLQTVMV